MKKLLIHLLTGVVVGLASNATTAQVLTVSFGDNYPYSIPEGRDGITYDVLKQILGQAATCSMRNSRNYETAGSTQEIYRKYTPGVEAECQITTG